MLYISIDDTLRPLLQKKGTKMVAFRTKFDELNSKVVWCEKALKNLTVSSLDKKESVINDLNITVSSLMRDCKIAIRMIELMWFRYENSEIPKEKLKDFNDIYSSVCKVFQSVQIATISRIGEDIGS